jgi:cytosine deaminase
MKLAIAEAQSAVADGNHPFGAVLVRDGQVLSLGRNRMVQDNDPTGHAEINALRNAGLQESYDGTYMVASAFPCLMCAGAIVRLGVPRLIVGASWPGCETSQQFMAERGVELEILELPECRALLAR